MNAIGRKLGEIWNEINNKDRDPNRLMQMVTEACLLEREQAAKIADELKEPYVARRIRESRIGGSTDG